MSILVDSDHQLGWRVFGLDNFYNSIDENTEIPTSRPDNGIRMPNEILDKL